MLFDNAESVNDKCDLTRAQRWVYGWQIGFGITESKSAPTRRRTTMQEHSLPQRAAAETIGTALLVLVGPGSVVATLVLAGKSVPAVSGADLLGISFAFGLIITALVYTLGKVSGCHINPAVTCALAVTKRFPWREVPAYVAAQVVGAVIGAFAIWAVFAHSAIDLGMGMTSFNEDATTWAQANFSEGIGTFVLMFAIL